MKKLLSVLSSTLQGGLRGGFLILALLATTSLWAYDFQSGDLYYNITSDSTVAVTYQEYNSSSNYASIYTVTIPETVTYDGTTYSVTSIGKYAFYDCSSLVSVTIPNSVTHIGDHAFYKTSSLTSVNIPNSVTSIGDYAFRGCSSLTAIDIPNSLTKIVHGMFDDCSSLATVTIPNSVTSIDTWAFSSCISLTSITIPNSVTRIGSFAFEYCRSLTAITIPESVTDIGSGAFESCSSLTSVVWNAKKCGQAYNYDGYTHFEIELMDSTNYSYEEIGEFVKYFLDEGNIINNSPFHDCDGIKSFSFGENVEFIPDGLCYGLDGITSITIPESISSIGERSFGECSSLDTIYCYSKNLPIMYLTDLHVHIVNIEMVYTYDEATPYIYDNTILYVPCQLLDAYKSQEEYTIRFPNIQCLEDLTPSEPQDTTIYSPTEGIGVFSVGEGKTVTFSRGNLQHTQSTNTWSFAENQWDMIGTDNVTGSSVESDPTYGDCKYGDALADKVDLFGWSTSTTNFGVSTSTSKSDYSGSFVDWGTNQIGADAPNTWRTLTSKEWNYLLRERPNYSELCGVAQVNGVNGLILLPDNWTCPSGVTFKSGFYSNYGVDYYAAYQTFTADQWSILEKAGAVFLPAAGNRYGTNVSYVQDFGYYWSATGDFSNNAVSRYFHSGGAYQEGTRVCGFSVRLVKDVNSTTPEPPVEPQDTTIYHPTEYATICEGTTFVWMGMEFTEIGTYTYEEIVEDENYIYHYIHTLELQVIAPPEPDTIVVEAYDSYEWHGVVYTESGTYIYEEHCYQEILQLTIIPSEDKEYVYGTYYQDLVCNGGIYVDPITGENYLISSLVPTSLTWSDTVKGTEVDTIHTFNITPIVSPEPLTEDMLYAIGSVPKLVAGEKVDIAGTTELIMEYYQKHDKNDIADVIGVEWVAGHDVVLDTEQTTHTMVLEVWDECDYRIPKEFTFPVSKKDSEPQDTTIYISSEDVTICEGITFVWMGMEFTEEGIYSYEEIVVEDDYIYHYIYTLHLMVLPPTLDMYEVTAYDSYEWHGVVYTESGVYTYSDPYNPCVIEELHLTIIDTPTIPTEYATICEGETYIWRGKQITEAGTYIYEEIVEDEDYTYHHTYTLELTVLPYETIEYEVEAYDSYVWHGIVYTESGTYTYQYECTTEVLYLTIIPSEDNQGEVVVEPSTNSVTITWQKEDDADTYIIVIKQGDKVVCTLIFDAEGNLVSVNYLPGRESNKHGIQHAGLTSDSFQYTITGLTPSTDYTYTVTATDDSDNTISSYSGEFTTHHATSVENTNSPSPTIDCQKILYEDHIYILRDGKIYSIMGQEM